MIIIAGSIALSDRIQARNRVLYGGDSAYHEHYRDLKEVDLAIMGIGAYDQYVAAHATPEQALQMADHCGAQRILPIHHSTFRLSHEPMHDPIRRLLTAAGEDSDRIVVREVGRSPAVGGGLGSGKP